MQLGFNEPDTAGIGLADGHVKFVGCRWHVACLVAFVVAEGVVVPLDFFGGARTECLKRVAKGHDVAHGLRAKLVGGLDSVWHNGSL